MTGVRPDPGLRITGLVGSLRPDLKAGAAGILSPGLRGDAADTVLRGDAGLEGSFNPEARPGFGGSFSPGFNAPAPPMTGLLMGCPSGDAVAVAGFASGSAFGGSAAGAGVVGVSSAMASSSLALLKTVVRRQARQTAITSDSLALSSASILAIAASVAF